MLLSSTPESHIRIAFLFNLRYVRVCRYGHLRFVSLPTSHYRPHITPLVFRMLSLSPCISHALMFLSLVMTMTMMMAPRGRGECVRLKNFVVNASITDNTIAHCGIYDFVFPDNTTNTGKNGEGIYIGTSSKQVRLGEWVHSLACSWGF